MSVTSVNNRAAVTTAIAEASRRTGIDFDYLLGQAQVESGLRSDARAATSSATGLYQFIDQSWLGVVKQHGADHGLDWAADSIRQTSAGRYTVDDPAMRGAILGLRNDPEVAALMAAEHAADNKAALETSLGRTATGTDLYMAHFLGLGGARSFLGAMASDPDQSGASLFPAAARANRGVFYTSAGQPRSLADIYRQLGGRLDRGATASGATSLASDTLDATEREIDAIGASIDASIDDGTQVILGTGAVDGDRHWVQTTLAQLDGNHRGGVDPLRPTPATARLAYLLLANLGA